MADNVVTIREAARRLDINEATVRAAITGKKIPARKSGGIQLLGLDDPIVQRYAARRAGAEALVEEAKKQVGPKCWECNQPRPRNGSRFCGQSCFGRSMITHWG